MMRVMAVVLFVGILSMFCVHAGAKKGILYYLFHLYNLWSFIGHSFPRQILPNSAAHRGKFLEFRGSPRPPTLESLCRL